MEELDTSSNSSSPANDIEKNDLKLGLALSGGGFRATLFHLGVIRSLRDNGQLSKIHRICSVSGGSVLAMHLLLNWDAYNSQDDKEFDRVAQEIIAFTKHDVRGRILRRGLTFIPLIALARKICFHRFPKVNFSTFLQRYYEKFLFKNEVIEHLPKSPKINILTTNLTEGGVCSITNDGFSIDERPNKNYKDPELLKTGNIPLSLAVTCSSAFPGMFPPMKLHQGNIYVENFLPEYQYFTDGGVFDNLGIRKFRKCLDEKDNLLSKVLVSNAGSTFKRATDLGLSDLIVPTALRSSDILFDRLNQTECEIARGDDRFVFINISEIIPTTKSKAHQGNAYFDANAINQHFQKWLKYIRTDLDAFPKEVVGALILHGQSVTKKILKECLRIPVSDKKPWFPLKAKETCFKKQDFRRTHKILQKSASRSLGLFSMKDWITYFHVLIVAAFIYGFSFVPNIYEHAKYHWEFFKLSPYASDFKVWKPLPYKDVDALPDPFKVNAGFTILVDQKQWDLRKIEDLSDISPEKRATEPISPALLTRYIRVKKDKFGKNEKFTINFKTEGVAIYPRLRSNRFTYEIQKAIELDAVFEKKVKLYALVVSIPEEEVKPGDEFELFAEAIFWNGFQGSKQWVGFQADEKINENSIRVIFPPSRPFINVTYGYGPRYEKISKADDIEIIENKDKTEFYWRIINPNNNWYYRLDWTW